MLYPIRAALGINMEDVIGVLNTLKSHLIAIGVVLAVCLVVVIAMAVVKSMKKSQKYLIRWTAVLAMLLAIVVVVNLFLGGFPQAVV